jgi:hypothetical protein
MFSKKHREAQPLETPVHRKYSRELPIHEGKITIQKIRKTRK